MQHFCVQVKPKLEKNIKKITIPTVLDPTLRTFLDVVKSAIDCRNQIADQNEASVDVSDLNDARNYMKAMLPYQSTIFIEEYFRMHLFVLGVIRDTVVFLDSPMSLSTVETLLIYLTSNLKVRNRCFAFN